MSMQDLLCKDYRKNPLPELIRFSIIIANMFIFFSYSGCVQNGMFGPRITKDTGFMPIKGASERTKDSDKKDPLIYFSSLDMIALLMSAYLSMKQLSFGRPEIDSFNEILYMPAQEKKQAVCLFIYCVFKFIFQLYAPLVPDSTNEKNFRDFLMIKKQENSREKDLPVWVANLILCISSAVSVLSSMTFKYEMRNAERAMTVQLFSFLSKVTMVAFGLTFAYNIFLAENKCLAIVYLLVLLYDIVRIVILQLYSEKKRKIRISDYLKSLKWISFVLLTMVIFGQVIFNWLRLIKIDGESAYDKNQQLKELFEGENAEKSNAFTYFDYFFLYFEPSSQHWRLRTVLGIYCLMTEAVILDFLNKIKIGASLDVFDLNVWSHVERSVTKSSEDLSVKEESYMSTFFIEKFFSILQIKKKEVFTATYEYSSKLILQLKAESIVINNKFERFKMAYSAILQKKQKFLARAFQFFKWLRRFILLQFFLRLEMYIRLVIYLMAAQRYLFFVNKPGFNSLFVYSLLIWCIFSMVCTTPRIMMWATIVLIYPVYVFDFVTVVYLRLQLESQSRKEIMLPLGPLTSLVIVSLASVYLLLTIAMQSEGRADPYHRFLDSLVKKNEASNKRFKSVTQKVVFVIFARTKFIMRYIPLLLAIYTALHSISLLNLVLLVLSLLFMWDSSLDKRYWGYFNCYTIFLIMIKQLCNYQLTLHNYNIESLAIIGFVSIEEHSQKKQSLRSLMVYNFLLIFTSCIWYKILHVEDEQQKNLHKEDQRRLRDFEKIKAVRKFKAIVTFFDVLFKYYSIWIFHIIANFLLLTDTRDVLSLPLIIFELANAVLHVAIWNRKGDHPYLKIYFFWVPMFYLVIFYSLSRYLFFFFKYTSIRSWFGHPEDQSTLGSLNHYIFRSISQVDEEDLHTESTFVGLYIRPLLLLSLAVFTREKFLNIRAIVEAKTESELKSNATKPPLAEAPENDEEDTGEEKAENSAIKRLTQNLVFKEDKVEKEKDEEFDKELAVGLEEGVSSKSISLSKEEKIQEVFKKDLRRQTTNANMFIVVYLIYKGLFLGLVMNFFHRNMNFFKLVMLFFYLLNMWTVFKKLAHIAEELKLVELFSLRIKYFSLTFLYSKKWDNECEIEKKILEVYDEEMQAKDFSQNKIYYQQFLLRMESVVFLVNRVFWALTFFPIVTLSALLFLMAFFLRDPSFISKYHLDFLTGLSGEKWGQEQHIDQEILGLQIITIGLLMEYMMTSYYLDLKVDAKQLDPLTMSSILESLIAKYSFLIETREQKPRKLNEEKFNKFVQAIENVPHALQTKPKNIRLTQDDPSNAFNFFNKIEKNQKKNANQADEDENQKMLGEKLVADEEDIENKSQTNNKDVEPANILAKAFKTNIKGNKYTSYLFSSNDEQSDENQQFKKGGMFAEKSPKAAEEEPVKTPMLDQEEMVNSEFKLDTLDYTKNILQAMLKRLTEENEELIETSIYIMSESISKEEMLLFVHRNKYKYYFCRAMEGLFYMLTRLSLLTLMIPFASQINLFTVSFYVVFCVQSFRTRQIFLKDVTKKNTLILIFLMIQLTHDFFHAWMMSDMDPENKTSYQYFMTEKKRYFSFSYLLKPIEGKNYTVSFYWVFLNSLAFALIPVFIWFSTKALFREKILKQDVFHCYIFDKSNDRNIVIDYNQWKNNGLKIFNILYKQTYLDSVDLHSTFIFLLLIAFWKDIYVLLFLYTLGVMGYENFRSDIHEESGAAKSGFRTRILFHVLRVYLCAYWFLLIVYHLANLLGHLGFFPDFMVNPEQYMSKYDGGALLVVLMTVSGIFLDLIKSRDFSENYTKLKMESNLKIRFSNLCRAYDINEVKIYARTVEIMRKKVIDDISGELLENKNLENMKINTAYSEKCFIKNLNEDSKLMTQRHLSFFSRFLMGIVNNFSRAVVNYSDKYRDLDICFLYHLVQSRNKILLSDSAIELSEYLSQDFNFFNTRFKLLARFYSNLVEGDEESNMKYKAKCEQFFKNNFDKMLLRPEIGKVDRTKKVMSTSSKTNILMEGSSEARIRGRQSIRVQAISETLSPISPGSGYRLGRRKSRTIYRDPALLEEAATILSDFILADNLAGSKLHFDSYKKFLQRYGSLNCTFGDIKVILYNINRDIIGSTLGFNKIKSSILIKYLYKAFNAKSEIIAACILIAISIFSGGFFNFVTIGILIFTIFIEESTGRSFWWKVVYLCYLLSMVMKQIYDQISVTKNHPQIVYFIFGKDSRAVDVALYLIPMYIIGVLKKYAADNRCAVDFENPGLAITRLVINEDFPNMVDRCCAEEIKIKEQTNIYLGSQRQIALTDIELQEFKMLTIKQVIKHYSMLEKFRKEFLTCCQKLVKTMKFDCMRVSPSDINRFFYRNFSQYMRKRGVSYNGISSVLLMIMIAYILTFFPTMESEGGQILGFLTENKVTAFTALNFAIYLTFFIINYLIGQMKSEDNKGLTARSYSNSLMANFDYPAPIVTDLTPIQKFRRRVNYVKNALTLRRVFAQQSIEEANKVNPLLYLFIFSLVVWTYVNFSVFFWHPYHSNSRRETRKGFYKFICGDKDQDEAASSETHCKNYLDNPLSQIFYFLNILFLIVCMKQIEAGKVLQITKITQFDRVYNEVKYKLYKVLPLVRPTQITFEYCATKTALWFKDFFLLKELEFLLQDAKIFHRHRMNKKAGEKINHRFQNIICWGVLIAVVLIFAIPLFLFYDSTNQNYYAIKSAAIKVELYAKDQKITDLFATQNLKSNGVLSAYDGGETLDKYILQTPNLKRYDREQFFVGQSDPAHRV